jgi:hypothetical protein
MIRSILALLLTVAPLAAIGCGNEGNPNSTATPDPALGRQEAAKIPSPGKSGP